MSLFRITWHLPLLVVILLSTGCSPAKKAPTAEEIDIQLTEQMSIDGGMGTSGNEPILASVSQITRGRDGNIFIYDGQSYRILQYTSRGEYVNHFGRKGGGPAEFESISRLFVDNNGQITATDPGNARFSVFSRQGDMLVNQPQLRIRQVTDIRQMPDGRYLVAGWHQESQRMLHILNADFSRILTSFGKLGDLTDAEDESVLQSWRYAAGYVVVLDKNRIAFAPGRYNGNIYFYQREAGGD